MLNSSDTHMLFPQRLIQRFCSYKGGTRVARRLANLLNQFFYNGYWIAFDRDDILFGLNINSELDWQILAFGAFDRPLIDLLKTVTTNGSVFIDIGANIGCISLPISKHVGTSGCVFAFEADPDIFQKLQNNYSLNSFSQLRPLNIALGSSPGVLTFYRAASTGSFGQAVGSLYANDWHSGGSSFEVSVNTLDKVLDEHNINRVDVIKIDVEGAEMDVLRGALQTIEKYHPILCLEVCEHTYSSAGWGPQDLFDLLSPFGYSFEALDERNSGRTRLLLGSDDRDYLTIVARVA